jgi:putative mRNA 3-end processing factor
VTCHSHGKVTANLQELWDPFSMKFHSAPLIAWTPKGLYCSAGDFYIDPTRAVEVAIITHAHSDHARKGHGKYICERSGVGLLKARLGQKIFVESYSYRESFYLRGVRVSLHSAGHILGSAQVRIEFGGEVWVASGDYKRDHDPSCEPFENVHCDTFITEATFGTPQFKWPKDLDHGQMIFDWWLRNSEEGYNSVLFGYSLGKAQRILAELAHLAHKRIVIHSTIVELTQCYRDEKVELADTVELMSVLQELEGDLILAPPSVLKETWAHRLGKYKTAFASGWMQNGRGFGSYDHGFVMSDHSDWNDLNQTIVESRAKKVFVQHRNGALIRHLKAQGLEAYPVEKLTYEEMSGMNLTLI